MSSELNTGDVEFFQKEVMQYNEVDSLIKTLASQIKPLQETLKNLKSEKKNLEVGLCKFMREKQVANVNLPHVIKNGNKVDYSGQPAKAIKYVKSEVVAPVTKDQIKESLIRFFSGTGSSEKFQRLSIEEKGTRAYNFIYDKQNRPKKTKETLRRVKYVESKVEKHVDIEVPIRDN